MNGLENRQQLVFTDDAIINLFINLSTLGLMQAVIPLYMSEGSAMVSYHFNHLTLQEFLAAIALSRLSDKERNTIIEKRMRDSFFTNVMRFYSGVIKFSPMLRDHMTRMLRTEEVQDKLIVFHWFFERGDKDAIVDIIGESEMSIRSHYSWSSLDYFVTGYCIARSNSAFSVEFYSSYMGNEKIVEFLQALISCPDGEQGKAHLTSLDFSANDLTLQSWQYLPNLPPRFLRHLKRLNVSFNNLDRIALDHINKTIPHTPQLEELNLSGNRSIQGGGAVSLIATLVKHKVLKTLILPGTNIAEKDCEQLAQLLSSSQCLEQLDVGNSNLSSDSLHILFRGLQQNNSLKYLRLTQNKLGDSEFNALCQTLTGNKTMTELVLFGCSISSIGGAALASTLMTNSTLEKLDIGNNSMGGEAALEFAELIRHNKTLKVLEINEDSSLTQSDINTLVDSLLNNTTLQRITLPLLESPRANEDKRVDWW